MTLIFASETQNPNISHQCRGTLPRHHAGCHGCGCACHPQAREHYSPEDLALQRQNLDTFARLQGFREPESFLVHVAVRRGEELSEL